MPLHHALEPLYSRELDGMHGWRLTREDFITIVHYTRNWLHYGTIGFISGCALIGAVRGVLAIS